MNAKTREEKRALLAKFKKPTDLELSVSGIVAEVVPPPVAAWIVAGEVPESLFGAAMSAVQTGPAAVAEALNLPEMFKLALRVARASFKWPRLVAEGETSPADDEDVLDPATLPMLDLARVLTWGLSGAKGAVVQTETGEVPADALHSFREDPGVPSYSQNGGQVQAEPGA